MANAFVVHEQVFGPLNHRFWGKGPGPFRIVEIVEINDSLMMDCSCGLQRCYEGKGDHWPGCDKRMEMRRSGCGHAQRLTLQPIAGGEVFTASGAWFAQ